jgi:hypothetical protein
MRSTNFIHIKPMGSMSLPAIGVFDIDYLYHDPRRKDNYTIRIDFGSGTYVHLSGEPAFEEWLTKLMGTLSPSKTKRQ